MNDNSNILDVFLVDGFAEPERDGNSNLLDYHEYDVDSDDQLVTKMTKMTKQRAIMKEILDILSKKYQKILAEDKDKDIKIKSLDIPEIKKCNYNNKEEDIIAVFELYRRDLQSGLATSIREGKELKNELTKNFQDLEKLQKDLEQIISEFQQGS